jgi:ribonuclease HI
MKAGTTQEVKLKRFHIDGAGARPNGSGSGYAWIRLGTEIQRIKRVDGLTNNQAEYRALLAVLGYVARESHLVISTDSQLVCEQFCGRYAVRDPKLKALLSQARQIITEKDLTVEVKWISREQNFAGRLLER